MSSLSTCGTRKIERKHANGLILNYDLIRKQQGNNFKITFMIKDNLII